VFILDFIIIMILLL